MTLLKFLSSAVVVLVVVNTVAVAVPEVLSMPLHNLSLLDLTQYQLVLVEITHGLGAATFQVVMVNLVVKVSLELLLNRCI
jgi:hypothetical protein